LLSAIYLRCISGGACLRPRTGGWLDAGEIQESPQTFKTADRNDWVLLINRR
jgi:hypothetical protein